MIRIPARPQRGSWISLIVRVCLLVQTCSGSAHASVLPDWVILRSPGRVEVEIPKTSATRTASHQADESGYIELLRRIETSIRRDGSIETRITEIRHFLTIQGVEFAGDYAIEAIPSHESITIDAAYVVTDDGSRIDTDASIIQITDVAEPGLFSGRERVSIPLPGLSPGAFAVVRYSSVFRSSEWPQPWAMHFLLQSPAPIEHLELEVQWEAGVPRPAWSPMRAGLECREQPNRLSCEMRNVPRLRPDADLSFVRDVIPEFVVAESRTWKEIAQATSALVGNKVAEGLPANVVNEVLSGAATEEERFQRLFDFVANKIRYVGLEHGTGAVVPRAPKTTLARRFGDCKDKVTLLVAMAGQAGLDVYPVLVGTKRLSLEAMSLPSPGYFDHMIVCLAGRDGLKTCADPTVTSVSPRDSALPSAGRIALDLRPETTAPHALGGQRYGWSVRVESDVEIRCDGSVGIETRRELRGLPEILFRKSFAGISPSDREQLLVADDLRVRGATQPAEISVTGMTEGTAPIVITSTYSSPARNGLPDEYEHVDNEFWLRSYGFGIRSENKVYPIWNPGLEVVSKQRYRLCADSRVRNLGPTLDLEDEFGRYERTYERTTDGVVVESALRVPSGVVGPDRIGRLNSFLDQALDQSIVWFDAR